MKAAIVYYSLDGNTRETAEKIAGITGAELLELVPEKAYPTGKVGKFFWGGKSVVFNEMPELLDYRKDFTGYDVVIVGTPVWASSFAPPVKTFLHNADLKNVKLAAFACSAGGGADKCFGKIVDESGAAGLVETLSLIDPKSKPKAENDSRIEDFCKKIMSL